MAIIFFLSVNSFHFVNHVPSGEITLVTIMQNCSYWQLLQIIIISSCPIRHDPNIPNQSGHRDILLKPYLKLVYNLRSKIIYSGINPESKMSFSLISSFPVLERGLFVLISYDKNMSKYRGKLLSIYLIMTFYVICLSVSYLLGAMLAAKGVRGINNW